MTKDTEWAKVIIMVENGICTVIEPTQVQDVNMDGTVGGRVGLSDLTPLIDRILGLNQF